MKLSTIQVKDVATLLNAVSGVLGIAFALTGNVFAWLYIIPAIFFDFIDGKLARKTKSDNDFGKQLDSLADTVSFVVAPVIITVMQHYDVLTLVTGCIFVCAGLLRLAWFNIQTEKGVFYGLPTPPAAAIVLIVNYFVPYFNALALVVIAWAMVSSIKLKKV